MYYVYTKFKYYYTTCCRNIVVIKIAIRSILYSIKPYSNINLKDIQGFNNVKSIANDQ